MNCSNILRICRGPELLAAVAAVSQWSCSGSHSTAQVDSGTTVIGCGSLSATQAVDITTQKLDAVLRAGLTSLAPVDDSRILARLLTLGNETKIGPSADGINNLDDLSKTIREDWLISENVETSTDSAIAFKLSPDNTCKDVGIAISVVDGGSSYNSSHQDCITRYTNHPIRFVVTRINCDTGDNVHIDLLVDAERKNVMSVELAGSNAKASLDLGQLLSFSNSLEPVSQSASQTTVFDTPTTGVLTAQLDVTGTNKSHFVLSLDPSLKIGVRTTYNSGDAGVTDTSLVSIGVGAKQNLVVLDADASAMTVQFALGLAQTQLDFPFVSFTKMFSRDAASSVKRSESVSLRIPAIDGNFSYVGAGDLLTATGLDIGQSASTITYGSDTLVSWDSNASTGRGLAFTATSQSTGDVALVFSTPFDVHVKYALLPVQSLIVNPQLFTLDDDIDFKLSTSSAEVTLLQDTNGHLSLTGSLNGSLFRVDTGTFEATSRAVPAANAVVSATQCLNRNLSASGAHAMLQTLSAGACTSP